MGSLGKGLDTEGGPRAGVASTCTSQSTTFSLQPPDLSSCSRGQIRDYFLNSYDLYETLFSCIKDESTFYKQPDKLRLQLIFYLGHTSAVYINKLQLSGALQDRAEQSMDSQFETGVDEMVWDTTDGCRLGGDFKWPSVDEVYQYRANVKKTILNLIDNEQLELPLLHRDPWWALVLGIEHERIHFETSSVLIRQLPVDLVKTPVNWQYAPSSVNTEDGDLVNDLIPMVETTVRLGKPDDFPSFGWDNEYGSLEVKVPAFSARRYLTTNREFMKFVDADGYNQRKYWTEEGWKWRCCRHAQHPTFWICTSGCKSGCDGDLSVHSHCTAAAGGKDGVYRYRAMFDVIDMPWDWPAETNYHEARAFCKWLGNGYRMLTEAEFVAIRKDENAPTSGVDKDIIYHKDVGDRFNLNMAFGSSTPVNFYPSNSGGFYDTMGNVWQWMEDHFNGFPGAKFDYLYHDFSTPYYDGYHNTILGGSWISTGDSASSFARFWFRRHFFQHMGFRVVQSLNTPPAQLLSTPVYQPSKGFIETEHPLPEFPEQTRIESFTSEFTLECDDHILKELRWDYGGSCKTKNSDSSKVETDGFPSFRLEEFIATSRNRKGSNAKVQSQCYWTNLGAIVKSTVNKIECSQDRALVIGCGTGRLAFEVSGFFDTVLGIHPVARSLEVAESLQQGKEVTGAAIDNLHLNGITLPKTASPNVTFKQFLWVPLEMGKFDLVILALLDIASCPEYWIARLSHIVASGGIAMVVSTAWNADKLEPMLAARGLELVESRQISRAQLADGQAPEVKMVSTWQHAK